MNRTAKHPTNAQLTAFGLGQLTPDQHREVEKHVAECDTCCQVLNQIPDDTLLDRLKHADTSSGNLDYSLGERAAVRQSANEVPSELLNHPRYRIVRVLGMGGMGVVYEAEHRLMERRVALKVISHKLINQPTALERFQIEVKAAARLSHANIVSAHDAEQAGRLHFLVMEFVEGVSLAKLVEQRGPLTVVAACNYIRQAAMGLQHAFERGMVHRDIKPQNLMVTRKGQVKVLDFGLARFAREQESAPSDEADPLLSAATTLTSLGTLLGTPDYIAPEQAIDSRHADIRADIYSLGCTLYFLLAGRAPFPKGTVMDKLISHRDKQPDSLDQVRADVPAELLPILERMMAKDAAERFQTPSEVVQALASFSKVSVPPPAPPALEPPLDPLASLPVRDEPLVPSTLPMTARAPSLPKFAEQRNGSPRKAWHEHRKPLLRLAGIICLVSGLAACGYLAAKKFQSEEGGGRAGLDERSGMGSIVAHDAPNRRVLFVLPSQQFWNDDYAPVRRVLEENGVKVVVGSTQNVAYPDATGGGEPVKADVLLESVNVADFDAVVFGGGQGIKELAWEGAGVAAAQRIVDEMRAANKHVAGLCMGSLVLASTGVLEGKRATCYPTYSGSLQERGAEWVDKPVVVSGRIVTGRAPDDAEQFAHVLLEQFSKK